MNETLVKQVAGSVPDGVWEGVDKGVEVPVEPLVADGVNEREVVDDSVVDADPVDWGV